MADYINPGAAFVIGMNGFLRDQDAQARQQKLDDLKLQQVQLEAENAARKAQNDQEDRQRKMVDEQVAQLMPGDVPDNTLMAQYRQVYGHDLATKTIPGQVVEGPTQDGTPLTDPDKNIYLGTPQFRMQQIQAQQQQALAKQKGAALAAAVDAGDRNATIQNVLEAGGTMADVKSMIDALGVNKGQPVYRVSADKGSIQELGPDGQWRPLSGPVQEKGHWISDPQPVHVSVNNQQPPMTDQALDFLVQQGLEGAPPPAFGSGTGGAKLRQQYQEKLAQRASEAGIDGAELARRQMQFKAQQGSAGSLQKNFDATEAFSDKAKMDLQNLNAMLSQVPDHSTRFMNTLDRFAARQGLEGADKANTMAAFDTYRQSVATEFSRIISQVNGGVLTDSARHEVNILLNPNSTVGQIQASIQALQNETANRHTAFSNRLDTLYTPQHSGAPSLPTTPPSTPGSFRVVGSRPAGK